MHVSLSQVHNIMSRLFIVIPGREICVPVTTLYNINDDCTSFGVNSDPEYNSFFKARIKCFVNL